MRGTNGQILLIGSGEAEAAQGLREDGIHGNRSLARRDFGRRPGVPGTSAVLEDSAPYAGAEEVSRRVTETQRGIPGGDPFSVQGNSEYTGDREHRDTKGEAISVETVRQPVPLCALKIDELETGRLIAALGPVVRRGVPLFCLDGGNAFNPYRLAILIRREGGDPFELLDRIYVSRAYTCHQLASSAETLLGALIGARPRPMIAVLGIDRLFQDEDLPMWEREFLYGRLLEHVRALHRRGLPVLVTFNDPPNGPWARRLRSVARLVPSPEAALGRLEAGMFGGTSRIMDGAPTERERHSERHRDIDPTLTGWAERCRPFRPEADESMDKEKNIPRAV